MDLWEESDPGLDQLHSPLFDRTRMSESCRIRMRTSTWFCVSLGRDLPGFLFSQGPPEGLKDLNDRLQVQFSY